ncbi:agmatine deiminase family protein [Sulfurimonas sp.]|uniref:agmatine deiminase family protein n=1 Tax=Sulfurimonas sp. TaxID=2022749 RepID=UPI00261BE797|nr:agmatine deiminase family protein [Sulfurimonas sp.]
MKSQKRLIAEFQMQTFTQIIFPHEATDWAEYLQEAQSTFVNIINAIRKYQKCLIICHDVNAVKEHFLDKHNLIFVAYTTNDTWARDCSALTVEEDDKRVLLDFTFNAWGGKFDAQKDNLLSCTLAQKYPYPLKKIDFVLEGGAVESNGEDMLLTTSSCMLNENRNPHLNASQITQKLKDFFGAKHILYLNHGYLAGDDTDSHIDTLARFISKDTIMYVQCKDTTDEHYHELKSMEEELQMIAKEKNLKLIALPMPDAIYYEEERLPATYANFLFVNDAILLPIYNVPQDKTAITLFEQTFPEREIIPLDASVLIRQHGSIHCISMNF